MEITQTEELDLSEVSFFMIPDIYQGNGYGAIMLEKFLELYIPKTKLESMLPAYFEYNSEYGEELVRLLKRCFSCSSRSYLRRSGSYAALLKCC